MDRPGLFRAIVIALALWCGCATAVRADKIWDLPAEQIRLLLRSSQVVASRTPEGRIDAYCHCPIILEPEEVPRAMIAALVAIEDKRFFARDGAVDWWGLAAGLTEGRGGSTIAMQLLKNLALSELPKTSRKVAEVRHADALLAALGREGTIVAYLNQVNFGGREVAGLYRAARHHFGKEPKDLDLWEIAVLAGMVVNPATHNPSSERADRRTNAERRGRLVLRLMRDTNQISEAQHRDALRRAGDGSRAGPRGRPPKPLPPLTIEARPFVEWVVRSHGDLVPANGTLRLFTTFDALQQSAADRHMRTLATQDIAPEYGAAAVVMSPEGEVRAIVGSRDWQRHQHDAATRGSYQVGSTAKAAVVVAACEAGLEHSTPVLDLPTPNGPSNGRIGYAGRTTLAEVIIQSRNAGTLNLTRTVGFRKVKAAGSRLGLPDGNETDANYVLGAFSTNLLTVTSAYATLANGGMRARPRSLIAAVDGDGDIVASDFAPPFERAVSPTCARFARDLFRQVVEVGTGRAARLQPWPAFGKTGTTNDGVDGLFVGWSGGQVVGFWMGKTRDGRPGTASGGAVPARFFRMVASEANARADQRRTTAYARALPPPRPKPPRTVAQGRKRPAAGLPRV